ncbi:MAG: carboxypeptidase regulatory-like domain-containing protein [Gemmatimonadota bacterium]
MYVKNYGWLAMVAAFAVGCGGDAGDANDGMDGGMDDDMADAAPAVDPAVAATINGTITFAGTPPAGEPIDMSEEPVCADKHDDQPMMRHVVTEGNGGGLANVFVHVKDGLGEMTFPTAREPVEIDQEGCEYSPHVLGIQTGQNLVIHNSDAVLHNINTQGQANRSFNISQPQEGMESTRTFNAPEVMIPVKCDVHGWMNAYIGVTASPYHAVTGEDGSFTIEGLPAGTYTIEAWHETLGAQTMSVTVGESETGTADFSYNENAAYAPVPMGDPIVLSHEGHVAG